MSMRHCSVLVFVATITAGGLTRPVVWADDPQPPLLQYCAASFEENASRFSKPGRIVYDYLNDIRKANGDIYKQTATIELYWKDSIKRCMYRGVDETKQQARENGRVPHLDYRREMVVDVLFDTDATFAHLPLLGNGGKLFVTSASQLIQAPKVHLMDISPQSMFRKPAVDANATFARVLSLKRGPGEAVQNPVIRSDDTKDIITFDFGIKYPGVDVYDSSTEWSLTTGLPLKVETKPTTRRSGISRQWKWSFNENVNAYVMERAEESSLPKLGEKAVATASEVYTLKSIEFLTDIPAAMFDRKSVLAKSYTQVDNQIKGMDIAPTK